MEAPVIYSLYESLLAEYHSAEDKTRAKRAIAMFDSGEVHEDVLHKELFRLALLEDRLKVLAIAEFQALEPGRFGAQLKSDALNILLRSTRYNAVQELEVLNDKVSSVFKMHCVKAILEVNAEIATLKESSMPEGRLSALWG
jgi:hypothetical protein